MDPDVLMQTVVKYGILVPIVIAVVEVLKRAIIPEKYRARVVPLISVGLGIGGAYLMVGFSTQAAFVGLIVGLMACGIWSGGKNIIKGNSGGTKLAAILLLLTITFGGVTGCATPGGQRTLDPNDVKNGLFTTKDVITLTAGTADRMCSAGLLNQSKCDKANAAYLKAQAAYDAAADALIMAMKVGNQEGWAAYEVFHSRFRENYVDLLTLLATFGVIEPAAADTYKRIDNPEVRR